MAKHVAYPCLIASLFIKFGGIDAKCAENFPPNHEKGLAIFSQYTSESDQYQEISLGDESPMSSLTGTDDNWLSSGELGNSEDSFPSSLGESDSEDFQPFLDSISLDPSTTNTPKDQRSVLYVKHLQMWIDNIKTDKPQSPEDHKRVFLKSFPQGSSPETIYRPITFEKISQNVHLYAPGLTPTKSTPRRKNNLFLLSQGKSPVWIDPRTGEQYKCHMHHLGQINNHTYIVMLPIDIHHLPEIHTQRGPSQIDRNRFAQERTSGRKELGRQIFGEQHTTDRPAKRFKMEEIY